MICVFRAEMLKKIRDASDSRVKGGGEVGVISDGPEMRILLLKFLTVAVLMGCSASQSARQISAPNSNTAAQASEKASKDGANETQQQDESESDKTESALPPAPVQKDKLKTGGAVYTQEQPGSYAALAASHVSQLSFSGRILSVSVSHDQIKSHYTQWVQVRSVVGDILSEKVMNAPDTDSATAQTIEPWSFDLNDAQLKRDQILYVYSSCGQHGIWRSEIKVP